jgi:hypothetical protein
MRLTVILMALACATPALAQQETNGPTTTGDQAAQLDAQRMTTRWPAGAAGRRFQLARKYAERLTNAAPTNLDVWLSWGRRKPG